MQQQERDELEGDELAQPMVSISFPNHIFYWQLLYSFQAVSFRKIEELENFGVSKTDVTKLKAGGYNTIESVRHIIFISILGYDVIFWIIDCTLHSAQADRGEGNKRAEGSKVEGNY